MLETVLLVVLVLFLLGALGTMPNWSHSRDWGYGPSSGLGLVVLVIVIILVGRLLKLF